jgi:hypothetical protein
MAPRIMVREDEEVSAGAPGAAGRRRAGADRPQGAALRARRATSRCWWWSTGQEKRIEFDALLCAVGRVARLTGYGLEELGIPTGRTIETNEYLQTLYPNIYAAGDVAGPYQFTHTAAHQAWYAAVNALFGDLQEVQGDYSVIPWATFIDPEVARVGLNEQEAKEKGIAYEVVKYGIDDLDRAIADSEAHGFRQGADRAGQGPHPGRHHRGCPCGRPAGRVRAGHEARAGLNKILGTIHTYPTLSEANKYAAGEWKRAHQPTSCWSGCASTTTGSGAETMQRLPCSLAIWVSIAACAILTRAGGTFGAISGAARSHRYAAWDALLRKHVRWLPDNKQSRVDYKGFAADRAALQKSAGRMVGRVACGSLPHSAASSKWPF